MTGEVGGADKSIARAIDVLRNTVLHIAIFPVRVAKIVLGVMVGRADVE